MEKITLIFQKIRKSKLLKFQILTIVICIVLGALLHFVYDWSGQNRFIAAFSAVNESVWEHLKLIFYPMLLMAIIEYLFVRKIANNYIEAKTIGIFTAISFTVVVFFTYTGIIGTHFLPVDLLIYVLSIIIGEYVAYKLMKREDESTIQSKILAIIITGFLLICFIVCTYHTSEVNLFRDYTNGTYGIE